MRIHSTYERRKYVSPPEIWLLNFPPKFIMKHKYRNKDPWNLFDSFPTDNQGGITF